MSKYIRRIGTPLALASVLAFGACKGNEKPADTGLAQDTALNRDLAMAGSDTAAQPQLHDVPATSGATTPSTSGSSRSTSRTGTRSSGSSRTSSGTSSSGSRTTASGNTVTRGGTGGGSTGQIAAGTSLTLASNSRVCTNTNKVGDTFTASVVNPVQGSNGVSIPAGATAHIQITELKRSNNASEPIVMTFRVTSITANGKSYPVVAEVTSAKVDKVKNQPTSKDVQKVVGGAVIGAVIGQVLGKNTKSTVAGAAAGAAAGTAVAMGTANYEGCIPQGGQIVIRLTEPTTVTAMR